MDSKTRGFVFAVLATLLCIIVYLTELRNKLKVFEESHQFQRNQIHHIGQGKDGHNSTLQEEKDSVLHFEKVSHEIAGQNRTLEEQIDSDLRNEKETKPGNKNQNRSIIMNYENYAHFIPNPHVEAVSCSLLGKGDKEEIAKAKEYQEKHPKHLIADTEYISKTKDCAAFIKERKYTMLPVSQEEANFPLAFAIIVFKDVEQVERLLRAVYRPQNYYCIHIDIKSSLSFKNALKSLVQCFDNVFITSTSANVVWGEYSVLEPDLICMEELWKYRKWKYFINLTGQEFPLHTSEDIVRILKALNGSNLLEGIQKYINVERTKYVHAGKYPHVLIEKPPPPINVTITKGAVHIIAQRGFIDFILHNKGALQFRNWLNDTGHPDETLFSTINFNPQLKAPGSYLGDPESQKLAGNYNVKGNLYIHRFKNWGDWPCHGQNVRGICIFGTGDLPLLFTRKELYANKFYLDYEPLVYECMEELLYNKTLNEFLGKRHFDISFYAQLDQVKNHVHNLEWMR